jgi:hypothetical protein
MHWLMARNEYILTSCHAKIRQMLTILPNSPQRSNYTGTRRLLFWRLRNSMCFQKHAIIRITSLWAQMLTLVEQKSVDFEALLR